MKTLILTLLSIPALLLADASSTSGNSQPVEAPGFTAFPTPEPVAPAKLKAGVQITEVGCMRTMVVFEESSLDVEKLITQRLSDADFRVFGPYKIAGKTLPDATACRDLGHDRKADLVALVSVTSHELNKFGNFVLYEADATVRFYSPVSAEMTILHTSRVKGERRTHPADAERSAREQAASAAVGEAVAKLLEKSHKILVHEAQIGGVQDRAHLEEILAALRQGKTFYHVREMLYDAKAKVAVLELVGDPASEDEWRQTLSKLPMRTEVKESIKITYVKNEVVRRKYPTWFRQK